MANKSYNLSLVTKKTFGIVLTDFSISASWVLSILQKNIITFVFSQTKKMFSTISLKHRIAISKVNFYEYLTKNFQQKYNLSFVVSELKSFTWSQLSKITLSYVVHERLKALVTISNSRFILSFDPILAQLITLGTWDVETLGTLDVLTLSEMDYSSV